MSGWFIKTGCRNFTCERPHRFLKPVRFEDVALSSIENLLLKGCGMEAIARDPVLANKARYEP